ncbi:MULTISPECIES: pyridoxal-phosphate dependent enzyme [unclassified Undibacterium]|uniref:pyridoxal-phosphate dependent enzyme n=1 Tax=unclassified Undibacterium TaxID=2630295 RepID=UPI002AC8A77B|nr:MULTISPECIES: pyridoxal-phosphate dependent enzyme [unclassified Undibacterium]MEB0138943.1 pyridoxal-phosphate dependent enzyme [Undibacterium sp. CCC2.1]MEB0171726.1 pyridoxal-phosphate dependent enzyme [Undibacterium sp. CCC1.1]MEB0175574.1 pyridoxal-phosphate dependent enzyme [Undibacterium sp. CCC3.4]MEB0214928.1 pyridoxal-phosphate dependent enzyme [Undibacterium sp. 5I2]WPX44912.1 pyridoxal-phosphate dependent enzyme [Undibacterium sp. CCC3.4]
MTTLHIATPLLEHRALSAATGKSVWLKMENTQPSGSFKLRGIGLMCSRAAARGATHFVCPSGGNAGFAAAVAGVALAIPTTILVPVTTHESVRAAIRAIGATVIVSGQVWDETNEAAKALCAAPGSVYIPPFDHADIWDGNASVIDELADGFDFDVVICSVGGGGLLSGVVQGLQRNGLAAVPVIAVETAGAASLQAAVAAGAVVTLPAITSIASSLGARRVAQHAYDLTLEHVIHSVTVSDAAAVAACLAFADEMRTLVEPACGAALAVVYQQLPVLAAFTRPLIIICGGIGVDVAKLAAWKSDFNLP